VEHYNQDGCCSDDAAIDMLVRALIPSGCPMFARNRWTDSTPALAWAGLLASIHGILQGLIPIWLLLIGPAMRPMVPTDFDFKDDDDLGPSGLVAAAEAPLAIVHAGAAAAQGAAPVLQARRLA
jgi:hypothetical protein